MAKSKSSGKAQILEENFWNQRNALRIGNDMPLVQLLPAIVFGAVVILLVRLHSYERDMDQFYWSSAGNSVTDFFSYYKAVLICICAIAALCIILYRACANTLYIRRNSMYIPMAIFVVFTFISWLCCEYKAFSTLGYNDRFEGLLPWLSYMVMLFFIINTVNSEKNVKQIIYPIAAASILLSLLGLSQGLDHDFFRTTFGKQLITPSWFWDNLDSLNFTFQNKEIYQTVYNINYVSFYLTLLVPLFGMIFIRSFMKGKEEKLWKKIFWGVMFALVVYNIIGAASSGGFLGMFFVVLFGIILLNKRLLQWWKPLLILILIAGLVFGLTYQRWSSEVTSAVNSVLSVSGGEELAVEKAEETIAAEETVTPGSIKPYIDYFETTGNKINTSFNGNAITFELDENMPSVDAVKVTDADGKNIALGRDTDGYFAIDDDRFRDYARVGYSSDDEGTVYFLINTADQVWPFTFVDGEIMFRNGIGKTVSLSKVDAIGFENHQRFGSGRGYIWSRSIPLMKETAIIGYGPDTYCLHYPHKDYVGKYNSPSYSSNVNIIVDKPHCLYIGMWTGCGGVATLAYIAMLILYIIQSVKAFRRRDYFAKGVDKSDLSFISFVGAGIFLGVIGFSITGLVDDSTVSTMPLFFTLLGTGAAINTLLIHLTKKVSPESEAETANQK